MEEINVSVLIPVYGVEKFIEKCARSLFEQTMQDGIEFIFVDDCSPDNSISVLKNVLNEYPNRKAQVTIIRHPENRGLAEARKTAVKASRGDFLIHCDSDDWVECDMYERLWTEANKLGADIVGCDIIKEQIDGSHIFKNRFDLPNEKQFELMLNAGYSPVERYLWCRLFRKSLYDKLNFENPAVGLWEDVCVSIPLHYLAKKIGYVAAPLYHYNRLNPDSYVSSFSKKKAEDMIQVGHYLQSFFSNVKLTETATRALSNRLLVCKLPLIINVKSFDPDRWRNLWPQLKRRNYPSLKMRFLMSLAAKEHDKVLLKIAQNGGL